MMKLKNGVGKSQYFLPIRSKFGSLARKVYFDQHFDHPICLLSPAIQFLSQGDAVQRVYHIKELNGIFRFIRLKVSDEVPSHWPAFAETPALRKASGGGLRASRSPNLFNLLFRLLHIVLAQNRDPCLNGFFYAGGFFC